MSERGSFASEYIYCAKCYKNLVAFFDKFREEKYFDAFFSDKYPIIAGKIGGLYAGEELHSFDDAARAIEKVICHSVRFFVFAEQGEKKYLIGPVVEKATFCCGHMKDVRECGCNPDSITKGDKK